MKIFEISGNQYISKSTKDQDVLQKIEEDFGKGFVRLNRTDRDIHFEIQRKASIPFLEIHQVYLTANDVKLLLGFTDSELEPKSDGTYDCFSDVIQINGETERYYSKSEVELLYTKKLKEAICANRVHDKGYEELLKLEIHNNLWVLCVHIVYSE